jgi:hypothetical protein
VQLPTEAMNEDETDDLVLLEQRVLDADDLVEAEIEPVDDDYTPMEEVILLDTLRLEDDDLIVA